MANKNVKDFGAVNSINLSSASILTVVAGELKRFTGQSIIIDSSGRVGIGGTPSSFLEVAHATADYVQGVIVTNTNTIYGSRLLFRSPLNTGTTISAASIAQGYDTTGRANLVFNVATSSALTERLRIAGSGNLYVTGTLSSSDKIGYGNVSGTGVGGTITQLTSKSTGVTLNKICGQIITNNAALAAGGEVSFTLTNSFITATDVVNVCIASGATAGAYNVHVDAVAAGSCRIALTNLSAGSLSEALTINFVVFKSVNA